MGIRDLCTLDKRLACGFPKVTKIDSDFLTYPWRCNTLGCNQRNATWHGKGNIKKWQYPFT